MLPFETERSSALDAALAHVVTVAETALQRAALGLDTLIQAAARQSERDALQQAQLALSRQWRACAQAFGAALRSSAQTDRASQGHPTTDWRHLSLVDDREVEERIQVDRIARQIAERSESQLRELTAYMGALLGTGRPDEDRHPLQPERIAAALCKACAPISTDVAAQLAVVGEVAVYVAQLMPACYDTVIAQLTERGVQPLPLVWRAVAAPGEHGGSRTRRDSFDGRSVQDGAETGSALHSTHHSTDRSGHSTRAGATMRGRWSSADPASQPNESQWLALLRRLTAMARLDADAGAGRPAPRDSASMPAADGAGRDAVWRNSGDLPSMMALNLIRAHRDELLQASPGKLDHMVIDVVGSLFDQILSDPRVPPQMARQIARLQLPVLRVALVDASFFSSRRHPVRRFINRIASLACPFDDFDAGPGLAFLSQVRQLVQDIVDGDFDQPELYIAKLEALEQFAADPVDAAPQALEAVTLFEEKESELRVQQRYMAQLQTALAPIALDDYLRTFLAQVWSQALVATIQREGAQAPQVQRLRQVAVEAAMSVQPKGSPTLRKKFLMQLPGLMKDLNAGMQLIGWPEAAQKAFFGQLLPAHAESLKGRPMSELEHNLLAKQLETIFNAPIPTADAADAADNTSPALPILQPSAMAAETGAFEPRLSEAEATQVGLLRETAIDWSRPVDLDLGVGDAALVAEMPPTQPAALQHDAGARIDSPEPDQWTAQGPPTALDLDLSQITPDPAVAAQGPRLIDHLRVGCAYQMHLNDAWHKVRLSHVSPTRRFFVFTHGSRHQQTVSLTARMVQRMCETHRLRAFENAYLIERASARARQQLAALRGNTRH